MKILIKQNNKIHPQNRLRNFLTRYGEVEIVNFANLKVEDFYKYNNEYDLVVLSGSGYKQLVGNESLYATEIEFVKQATVPIFSICFGLEIIALAYKLPLLKLERKEGVSETAISSGENEGTKVTVYFSNYWFVPNNRVDIITPVSTGKHSGVESIDSFVIPGRKIFAVQFHPENESQGNEGKFFFEGALRGFGIPFEVKPLSEINRRQS